MSTVQRLLAIDPVTGAQGMVVPLTVSAGPVSAGQVPALNQAGALDITMMPTGIGATTQQALATAALTAYMLVNIYSNAGVLSVRPADSTFIGSDAKGYVIAPYAAGTPAIVYIGVGILSGLSGLAIGKTYFLSTVGSASLVVPSTVGNIIQSIGTALSSTSIMFRPAISPITVA